MPIDDKVLHLALGFDRNYLTPFYTLAASVFKNNPRNTIHFHVVVSGLTDEDVRALQEYIVGHGGQLYFYQAPDDFAADFTFHSWFGRANFFRLLIPGLLPPEVKRFLYVDTDTVIIADLAELFSTDMQGFPLAAVPEPVIEFRPELGLKETDSYFNSGVLLVDPHKWVEQKISEKALDFLSKNHKIAIYVDQDALNAVLIGNWLKLDARYNLMRDYLPRELRKSQIDAYLKDKVIVHFTQYHKPWHTLCNNRLRHLYTYYQQFTPVEKLPKPKDVEMSAGVFWKVMKIRGREWYYDYPVIPVSVVDKVRKLFR